jgi:hypothetical protein
MTDYTSVLNADQRFEIIKKEIDVVDGRIKQMEETRRIIKNWCVITWAASVGIAIREQQSLIFLTSFLPAIFFGLEALYRRQQNSFETRMQEIAEFLNNYSSDFKLLLIRNQFGKSHYDPSKNVVKSIKNSIKQDKIMAWVLKSPSV